MENIVAILSAIINKTNNDYLLFSIVIAVIIIAVVIPLGLYYLKCKFNKNN
ncbi:hypothetical protein [Pectinatus cerevisiiphilus]|uniref:Uncharacterized protein n=1 Tax=Pectinatus cerevisiiphilus TaxID=86956 RepID=A0A4R3KFK0_9FIRM|nr:hypothetical protein [Pectinatus cerevisiiphilus]TCS82058.1 hypothetical protein EDC37_101231 [Pectinatus cerevisiiphilus]